MKIREEFDPLAKSQLPCLKGVFASIGMLIEKSLLLKEMQLNLGEK
jgi:hypothetical protein